jgi:hypothetical protein
MPSRRGLSKIQRVVVVVVVDDDDDDDVDDDDVADGDAICRIPFLARAWTSNGRRQHQNVNIIDTVIHRRRE